MFAALSYPLMGFAVLLGIWTLVSFDRNRPTGETQMALVLVLEAALLAQSVIAWVRLSGAGIDESVTFIAYSIGILAPVGAAFYLARIERTRWGSVIVAFACGVVAVMTLRLVSLWGLF